MNRIIVDVRTGEQSVVSLTPEEEADAAARTAAEDAVEAPKRAELVAIAQIRDAVKADVTTQNFFTKTDAEIMTFVRTQIDAQGVTDLASAKAALVKMETLLGKLGVIVAALGRTTLKG